MKNAEVIVFATPIYYYEMSGQMKTMLDRANSLFPSDYKFRDIYFLSTAADDEEGVDERAIHGLEGWLACYENAALPEKFSPAELMKPARSRVTPPSRKPTIWAQK